MEFRVGAGTTSDAGLGQCDIDARRAGARDVGFQLVADHQDAAVHPTQRFIEDRRVGLAESFEPRSGIAEACDETAFDDARGRARRDADRATRLGVEHVGVGEREGGGLAGFESCDERGEHGFEGGNEVESGLVTDHHHPSGPIGWRHAMEQGVGCEPLGALGPEDDRGRAFEAVTGDPRRDHHSAGEDLVLLQSDVETAKPREHLTLGSRRVVAQEQALPAAGRQRTHEGAGVGQGTFSIDQHAVRVEQERVVSLDQGRCVHDGRHGPKGSSARFPRMSERAFVAGATGYTGRAVVAALCEQGVDTVAHVRPKSSSLEAMRERFEAHGARVDTTAWELDAMVDTLRELSPTVVFALLGTTRKRAASEGMDAVQGYEAVDYGLTKLLLDACAKAAPDARFVYLSSLGVTDGTRNAYLSARARIEAALREGGQPYTIARPSFITGPDRSEERPGERMGAAMADAMLRAAGWFGAHGLRDRYRSMDATTLAAGLVRAAFDPQAAGAVLEADALR